MAVGKTKLLKALSCLIQSEGRIECTFQPYGIQGARIIFNKPLYIELLKLWWHLFSISQIDYPQCPWPWFHVTNIPTKILFNMDMARAYIPSSVAFSSHTDMISSRILNPALRSDGSDLLFISTTRSGTRYSPGSGAPLTKVYDVTIQRYRNSHAKIEDSTMPTLRCMG